MKECKDSNNLMGEMFTDRLIKLRQARGWTKKEFSARIGKTQQTVGKWENGRKNSFQTHSNVLI